MEQLQAIENATKSFFINGLWVYLITSAAVLLFMLILLRILKRVFRKMKERRPEAGLQINFLWNIVKALCFVILGVGLTYQIVPLHNISVSLLASSGLLAVFIGAASQDAVSNIVGGFFIALFHPFAIGDRIRVQDHNILGIIEDITTRHTVIRTFENSRVIVPNKIMNSAVLENFQFSDSSVCNFFDIGVSYDADLDKAMDIIRALAVKHPNCLDHRSDGDKAAGAPIVPVKVIELGEYAVKLRASIWSTSPGTGYDLLCDLRKSVKETFDAQQIQIPVPMRDILIRKEPSS